MIASEKQRGLRVFEANDSSSDVDGVAGDKTVAGVDVKSVGEGI